MAKKKRTRFICSHCGWESSQWLGNCSSCSRWNTLEEVLIPDESGDRPHRARLERPDQSTPEVVSMHEIPVSETERLLTGMDELDRVLGGGIMPGSLLLLGGDPGVGKSTLAMQCASFLQNVKNLYVSGEESLGQIRRRAERLGIYTGQKGFTGEGTGRKGFIDENTGRTDFTDESTGRKGFTGKNADRLRIFAETEIMRVIEAARSEKPELLIVDSVQTMYHNELQSMPGTTAQIRECAALLMQYARQERVTVMMIGHVTKDGDLAGPRVLEHMVDTVLQFEGDKQSHHRILRSIKNRFGPAQEVGVFEMNEEGLQEVNNPSELFLSEYDASVSGNAVVCSIEGTRPLLIEVQALVAPASYGMPQRTASGFDHRRLSLLLAVLEKRCGWPFSRNDVFLNVAGGMKLMETACDLGIATALVSSISGKASGEPVVVIGEIGLGAEIRRVTRLERRLEEAVNLGFRHAVVPKGSAETYRHKKLSVSSVGNVDEALRKCGLEPSP